VRTVRHRRDQGLFAATGLVVLVVLVAPASAQTTDDVIIASSTTTAPTTSTTTGITLLPTTMPTETTTTEHATTTAVRRTTTVPAGPVVTLPVNTTTTELLEPPGPAGLPTTTVPAPSKKANEGISAGTIVWLIIAGLLLLAAVLALFTVRFVRATRPVPLTQGAGTVPDHG
jgi:hypothetical protein